MSVFGKSSYRWRYPENCATPRRGQEGLDKKLFPAGWICSLTVLAATVGILSAASVACSDVSAPEVATQPTSTTKIEATAPSPPPSATVTRVVELTSSSPTPTLTLPALQRTPTPLPVAASSVASSPAPVETPISPAASTQATATLTPLPTRTAPSATPVAPTKTSTNSRKDQSLTTSHLVERSAEFARGQLSEGVTLTGDALRLTDRAADQQFTGEYLSQAWETEFLFDDAVLSWNAEAVEGTSLRFELRVRIGDQWSGWYAMGEWSSQGGRSLGGQADAFGSVNIDTLKLKQPANVLQYRVRLTSSLPDRTPLVRQIAVVYANMARGLSGPQLSRPEGGARDLDVPQRSQLDEDPAVARTICSPTSLAMVLQYWGSKMSVAEVYAGVRDRTTGIYGNWPLNTAFAGANGFQARVDRFYSVVQLEQEIAAGRPVIVSVAYGTGELSGAAAPSTDGHLIVVRGFTADGNVIVNDPIAPSSRSVRLVYNRDQFQKVWLRSGGVVYLVQPQGG